MMQGHDARTQHARDLSGCLPCHGIFSKAARPWPNRNILLLFTSQLPFQWCPPGFLQAGGRTKSYSDLFHLPQERHRMTSSYHPILQPCGQRRDKFEASLSFNILCTILGPVRQIPECLSAFDVPSRSGLVQQWASELKPQQALQSSLTD
eukprot:1134558-Pelagomonas_calceolata.AAC.2